MEAKHVNEFRPDDVLWEKISKGLLRNPDRPLKIPTRGCLRCRANPNLFRRSFEPYDQMLYHRMVLEPHTAYPIPAGTRYILLTVQKTVFETNKRPLEIQPRPSSKRNRVFITPVIRPPVAPVLIARPSTALSTPQPILLPDPPPAPIPPELTTPQILLPDPPVQTTPQILLPDPPVQTTPQILLSDLPQPPVLTIPPQPPELMTPQIFLPDPPVQMTPQILLPDPPPVVETLEPTLMDASSID
ncbi:hypothetical protein TNCV_2632191 [Trichonephila clavipes]|nr:hypothetical protein TNCV_2632191 [Trichonephila clavipes]